MLSQSCCAVSRIADEINRLIRGVLWPADHHRHGFDVLATLLRRNGTGSMIGSLRLDLANQVAGAVQFTILLDRWKRTLQASQIRSDEISSHSQGLSKM